MAALEERLSELSIPRKVIEPLIAEESAAQEANESRLNQKDWTPREMRHSFVSLLSDAGMPIEAISRLVSHRNTSVTETVYRKQLRPVLLDAAEAMDEIFPSG